MLYNQRNKFTKKTKGWISNNNISFIQQVYTFQRTKIPITIQLSQRIISRLKQLCYIDHIYATITGYVIDFCNNSFVWTFGICTFTALLIKTER